MPTPFVFNPSLAAPATHPGHSRLWRRGLNLRGHLIRVGYTRRQIAEIMTAPATSPLSFRDDGFAAALARYWTPARKPTFRFVRAFETFALPATFGLGNAQGTQ